MFLTSCVSPKIYKDLEAKYADLKEEIYMDPPPGVKLPGGCVFKLLKSLYGLKQSPRNWNEKLESTILNMGFQKSK